MTEKPSAVDLATLSRLYKQRRELQLMRASVVRKKTDHLIHELQAIRENIAAEFNPIQRDVDLQIMHLKDKFRMKMTWEISRLRWEKK